MKQGFIKLSRKFFENALWKEPRQYSRSEAWLDLIQMARFEDSNLILNNRAIEVQRGEIAASRRLLENRWSWGSTKVINFLDYLRKNGMINQRQTNGQTIITLCNYDTYNTLQTSDDSENKPPTNQRQTRGKPPTNQNKEYKESKEGKEIKEYIPPTIPHVETRDVFEKFKDEMLSDDFWVEQQAMTSGIGNKFTNVVSVALAKFFSWIVSTGNEETIKTLNDAKRRFFYWWRDHGKPEFEKEYTSTSVDTSRIALGIGVWIDGGKKFYGSRENPREIPLNAPYRPAQDAKWDATNERWTISGG